MSLYLMLPLVLRYGQLRDPCSRHTITPAWVLLVVSDNASSGPVIHYNVPTVQNTTPRSSLQLGVVVTHYWTRSQLPVGRRSQLVCLAYHCCPGPQIRT